jgi:hypothetical protein
MRVACLLFHQQQDLRNIAEIFYRASPQIMRRGNEALFIEISRSLKLYSEITFLRRTQATLKRIAVSAKVAIADDIPTALSFAYFNKQKKEELPLEALLFYFDPLNENKDQQAIHKMIKVLHQLGFKNLADLKRLSIKEISSRFGNIGLSAFLRVGGEMPIPWRQFTPQEIVFETFEFDLESPVENLEPVYFRLNPLLERIVLRLKGKGRRIRQYEVCLKQEHDSHSQYKIPLVLQLSHINNKVLFQITKEAIDRAVQLRPLKSRITAVAITVTEEAPYSENQKDIFNPQKEEKEESFFHFLSRVSTKLGENSVFFARLNESFLPEKNWFRSNKELPFSSIDSLPERPLRIFSPPYQVQLSKTTIRIDNYVDEIVEFTDREIVFSDWWSAPLERVYFRILTQSGRQFWIYRNKEGDFLHGEFD